MATSVGIGSASHTCSICRCFVQSKNTLLCVDDACFRNGYQLREWVGEEVRKGGDGGVTLHVRFSTQLLEHKYIPGHFCPEDGDRRERVEEYFHRTTEGVFYMYPSCSHMCIS